MSDPRRRAGTSGNPRGTLLVAPSWEATDGDWPVHPWVAVVERFGSDPARASEGEACRVVVIWWQTRAGRQPVLLVQRIRRH